MYLPGHNADCSPSQSVMGSECGIDICTLYIWMDEAPFSVYFSGFSYLKQLTHTHSLLTNSLSLSLIRMVEIPKTSTAFYCGFFVTIYDCINSFACH